MLFLKSKFILFANYPIDFQFRYTSRLYFQLTNILLFYIILSYKCKRNDIINLLF